ncbi:glycoside hydrolase family 28 protein [Proteiniclasticum sp. C24MP]|uniref:glycoside hydrolase family 28 protein n=1 Tax=Proteiniclasticum sp. C24MP TaxID=3374101 RepID=UPI003753F0F5
MNKKELREKIITNIEMPKTRDVKYMAEFFDIYPSDNINQTVKFQNAIDAISNDGGGSLVIPPGVYCTGALKLRSGINIHLSDEDSILRFINYDLESNYPAVFSHWEASPCINYSPLLYGIDLEDVSITGRGVLDGGADDEHWWNWHHQVEKAWSEDKSDLQLEDRKTLRKMNTDGVPVSERIFGSGHYLRPNFIQIINGNRILLQDVHVTNSPMWLINPILCKSVIVDGVKIKSYGPNNDGCDPESCNGVWIRNCTFDTGDDCISIKSGRDRDGRELNVPCENILIENNLFSDGHGGIALGSEMSGGIRNLLADGNKFTSPNLTYALRLKTNAKRGGFVEQIMMTDTVIEYVSGAAIHGTMLYEDGYKGNDFPVFKDIRIENVTARGGDYGVFLESFDEVPIEGLVLKNIDINDCEKELHSRNWRNPVLENLKINGKSYPRPESIQILGVPYVGIAVKAKARHTLSNETLKYIWEVYDDKWTEFSVKEEIIVPPGATWIRVSVIDSQGNKETSLQYRITSDLHPKEYVNRFKCRGFLEGIEITVLDRNITKKEITRILYALIAKDQIKIQKQDEALDYLIRQKILPATKDISESERYITRQEMATVAMQACGVSYRNGSSTMPECRDAEDISKNYGTNVDRALFYGFMKLDDDRFHPKKNVTVDEAIIILNTVADFAGI